jgi:hypothetical protein
MSGVPCSALDANTMTPKKVHGFEESSRLRRAMSWSYFLSLKIRYVKARTKFEVQRL